MTSWMDDMMGKAIDIGRAHPLAKALLPLTFPAYKGRKIRVKLATRPVCVELNGGGGTFERAVAVRMTDGVVAGIPVLSPFDAAAIALDNDGVTVPPGVLLVVHSHFCGKDAGITIHVAPPSVPRLGAATVAGLLTAGA